MTAHTCQGITPGCYRCDLNIDEMRTIKRRDYKHTTRLWGKCENCRETWQWNGKTENVDDGLWMIKRSKCACNRAWSGR